MNIQEFTHDSHRVAAPWSAYSTNVQLRPAAAMAFNKSSGFDQEENSRWILTLLYDLSQEAELEDESYDMDRSDQVAIYPPPFRIIQGG
jgi:hypothetical protein